MKNKTKTIINKQWDEIFNTYSENNFSNHAFPLYLFTERLYNALKQNNCQDVLFMSREGQFLKKLFDRYCEIKKELQNEKITIKTHYFYGSRNSVMAASLKPLEEENFDLLFKFFSFFMNAKRFLISIGFSDEQINELEKSFGKKINKVCLDFKSSKIFKQLKANETFKNFYNENRKVQSKAFELYLNSFKVNYLKDGFTFVDIGYHGTMQDLIFKFLNKKIPINGYFIKSRAKQEPNNKKIGLLGDKNTKNLFGDKITKYDSFNYEQILRADHGRCLGYTIKNNTSLPIIDEKLNDKETFEKSIKQMQNQIFDKFENIAKIALSNNLDITNICIIYYYYTIKNKTKADYNWILNMQDNSHDDFGFVGHTGKIIARNLRKFAFKLKDKIYVLKHKFFIKKLIKNNNKF